MLNQQMAFTDRSKTRKLWDIFERRQDRGARNHNGAGAWVCIVPKDRVPEPRVLAWQFTFEPWNQTILLANEARSEEYVLACILGREIWAQALFFPSLHAYPSLLDLIGVIWKSWRGKSPAARKDRPICLPLAWVGLPPKDADRYRPRLRSRPNRQHPCLNYFTFSSIIPSIVIILLASIHMQYTLLTPVSISPLISLFTAVGGRADE